MKEETMRNLETINTKILIKLHEIKMALLEGQIQQLNRQLNK